MSDEMRKDMESMDDYAAELEASYKEYDERRSNQVYVAEEDPQAEAWQNLGQMKEDRTVVKVKIKEIVKGGAIAYVDEMKAFIPASQLSLEYIEKLDEWVGRYVEALVITVDPENKRLVLSAKELLKERAEAEKQEKLAQIQAGQVVEGVVDSLKPYGAFVNLDNGLSGLLHISQISSQRIKHPGAVLKEGQSIKVKILSVADGKISLSMKALEPEDEPEEKFDYKENGSAFTGLGDLLKGIKL
ncbi:S1 RNA-binding domain-containing protein [Clostridium sp. MCC353]|uniref:S1 RNA-binding domain-containing protein n=1 Tax=Clostridium sp. MCC353 TaxID=2592646 RepID=UPI001C00FBC5|nr:S1 RNA-binding domain-containing protein [Clostridium sp. MCC353]MBT9778120.1 S1 RNA-binding domain-containing protein [Clostridium sp. MCC353]